MMKGFSRPVSIGLFLFVSGCASTDTAPVDAIARAADAVVSIGNATHTLASGFFVTPQLLVTNQHIIQTGELYLVALDGRRRLLRLVLEEAAIDLAIFRVQDYESKNELRISTRPLRVGLPVIAIGNPFGAGITASAGIVSALPRAIGKQHLLQTDAAINPGNSGGPLINLQGEVVGLVTSRGAVGSGIGFALPADQLIEVVQRAKEQTKP